MPIVLELTLGPVVRERAGQRSSRVRLETEAQTLSELIRWLGIADLSDTLMVVVNHHMVTDDGHELRAGDHVGLYLPLEGG